MEELLGLIPESKRTIWDEMINDTREFFAGHTSYQPTEWKGYRFPPAFQAGTAKYAYEEMDFKERSVFIISYPKSGTNWLQEVVRGIMYGHDANTIALSKATPPPMFFLEACKENKFQLMEHMPFDRHLFISHLPEELFNVQKVKKQNGKMIVIMRNPKDQAVSWFHFTQTPMFNTIREEISSDWNQFFSDYTQGKHRTLVREGEWYPDHILGWHKYRDDEDFLFVRFEDMKKDIKKEIRRIGKFLSIDLSEHRIDQVAKATSFDSMKNAAENKENELEKARASGKLIRKGQVGSWKETFTVAQSEFIDKVFNEKLGDTDIKFTYEL